MFALNALDVCVYWIWRIPVKAVVIFARPVPPEADVFRSRTPP